MGLDFNNFKRFKRKVYGRFIDFTIDIKFLFVMKAYQLSLLVCTFILILTQYDNVDENFILLFWFGSLLNCLLFCMQLSAPVLHPTQSKDLVTVLVVIIAQVLPTINISLAQLHRVFILLVLVIGHQHRHPDCSSSLSPQRLV